MSIAPVAYVASGDVFFELPDHSSPGQTCTTAIRREGFSPLDIWASTRISLVRDSLPGRRADPELETTGSVARNTRGFRATEKSRTPALWSARIFLDADDRGPKTTRLKRGK